MFIQQICTVLAVKFINRNNKNIVPEKLKWHGRSIQFFKLK